MNERQSVNEIHLAQKNKQEASQKTIQFRFGFAFNLRTFTDKEIMKT